ncbi:hypothetical protein HHI36_018472 [Cryptolaemus montrouzieri]|uniref:Uncharacterized protein n=1 Tax=Cryptolaemus montrouzieri TaxID=559131 RepID=A0ABD2P0A6_9CUCU
MRKNNSSWVNSTIKKSSENLRKWYPELKTTYNDERKKHLKLTERVKRDYYQQKIMGSDKGFQAKVLADDGIEVVEPHEVANTLGSYFKDAPLETIAQMGCTSETDELGADAEFSGSFSSRNIRS